MNFDPGKVWPHPVLRPPVYGDDYLRAEFEVDIDVARVSDGLAVNVEADFKMSDPDLLRLTRKGSAKYVLVVRSPRTHHRESIKSIDSHMAKRFASGDLSGKVEFSPFLVATKKIEQFRANGWHADFNGLKFDIEVGSVLAIDVPKAYWIDTADESPIGSIFEHISRPSIQDGTWAIVADNDRIGIVMSKKDSDKYLLAREKVNNQAEGYYLMNGLYFPALLQVLSIADNNPQIYENYRWFTSLNNRLEDVGCDWLGSNTADRLKDAQRVLEYPFTKMPLMAEVGIP